MTNTFIDALEKRFNYKFTENMGIALKSTGSKVYDLFALGGAYRQRTEEDCITLFKEAFDEDPILALKCLFYLRDCRGGQGERRFFRICFRYATVKNPNMMKKYIKYIPYFGRWDDLFCLFHSELEEDVLKFIVDQLTLDMSCVVDDKQGISLLAKWMPSENAHSRQSKRYAKLIREYIGMTSKEYRKMLSKLREHLNILERLMSENRWDEIEFDKIPSKAGLIYHNAFARRDLIAKKYENFITDENTKVNADTLYPYEVVQKVTNTISWNWKPMSSLDRAAVNKYWENLPDYLDGADLSMLCVVDTSGSMTCNYHGGPKPIDVAISLGLYCAERMTGPFANKYISFASRPQLINTNGKDFVEKVLNIYKTNLVDNTNLPRVFDLLLSTARQKDVKKEDLPKTIVVISDMEIDSATGYAYRLNESNLKTTMEHIREQWKLFGYELPKLVYWNVNARNNTILDDGPNVSYVSGCNPVIFKQVLTGKTGVELMLEVLLGERYKVIE